MTEIGKIVTTRGIKGELKILPFTNISDMFDDLAEIYIDGKKYTVESVKHIKNCVALKLGGIDSPEDAALYINKRVEIDDKDLKPLDDDEYYIKDLIGFCIVNSDTGENTGTLANVIITGGHDVLDITAANGKQVLVPMVKEFVKNIDTKNKIISVHFIDGMLEV